MRNTEIENEMYRRAVELIEKRYPVGWGGAGVVHTANGNYYTSVSIETANASAIVCIELGAMLEAHKFNEKVTHCLCLIRNDETSDYKVLSPCGICQERLRFWGGRGTGCCNNPGRKTPICGIERIAALSLDKSLSRRRTGTLAGITGNPGGTSP